MPCALAFLSRCETSFRELRAARPKKIPKGVKDFGINGNELAPS